MRLSGAKNADAALGATNSGAIGSEEPTLVNADLYLKTGSHIATRFKSGDMVRFIYKVRKDGLKVFNVMTIDERIRTASNFLSSFESTKIVAVSRKLYGQQAVKSFASAVGGTALTARFVPGTFTNPSSKRFVEPAVVIVTEPEADAQAVSEARRICVPVVALCSTNNSTADIDVVIPVNNKGRKSIALVYWLLAREMLKKHRALKKGEDFKPSLESFEYKSEEGEAIERENAAEEETAGKGAGKGRERQKGKPRFRRKTWQKTEDLK